MQQRVLENKQYDYGRFQQWEESRLLRVEEQRRERLAADEQELSECTFTPRIEKEVGTRRRTHKQFLDD